MFNIHVVNMVLYYIFFDYFQILKYSICILIPFLVMLFSPKHSLDINYKHVLQKQILNWSPLLHDLV
jgi:hypothetical protein